MYTQWPAFLLDGFECSNCLSFMNEKMAHRQLSLRLYDILEDVGASEEIRRLHRKVAITLGVLNSVDISLVFNKVINVHICGSSFEGSVTPDLASDVDVLESTSFLPVVWDAGAAPSGLSLLAIMDDCTYPGYVKLQLVMEGLPVTYDLVETIYQSASDTEGRVCVTNTYLGNKDGAAYPHLNENGFHFADQVRSCHSDSLPGFVRKRLCTLKRHKLITEPEAVNLGRMGSKFVGVGYFKSSQKDIEWRLSLSLQEKYLMSKLNPTQHKVYILLKMIKRDIIEKTIGCKVLTSYHCKTCVLYTAEMFKKHLWTPENLIKCFLQCVKLFIRFLKWKFCPNFFIPNQNLFSKEGFSRFRTVLVHAFESVIESKGDILKIIESDRVGHMLQSVERIKEDETCLKKGEMVFNVKYKSVIAIVIYYPVILNKLCGCVYDAASLDNATIYGYTPVETQSALSYLYPWFHLHIANALACESLKVIETSQRKRIMAESDLHFEMAKGTDRVNVGLAKASILYRSGQFDACFLLLQQVERLFTFKVKRICPCVELHSMLYLDQQEQNEMFRSMSSMSVRKMMRRCFACCVIFLPSESDIVPAPLQYEMRRSHGTRPGSRNQISDFWFDWAVVDAKVFLYFMQYLVSAELGKETHKQVATGNILAMIVEDELLLSRLPYNARQLGHRETAYNLLGWIYMQDGRYDDAWHCFEKSWTIRPHHNAAKFHMRDLLTRH